jgi:hypothetical protein
MGSLKIEFPGSGSDQLAARLEIRSPSRAYRLWQGFGSCLAAIPLREVSHLDGIRTLEPGVPLDDGQAVHAAQPLFDIRAGIRRDGIGPGLDPPHVNPDRRFHRDPVLGASPGQMGRVGTGDQRLGWHAAGVDTGAAA